MLTTQTEWRQRIQQLYPSRLSLWLIKLRFLLAPHIPFFPSVTCAAYFSLKWCRKECWAFVQAWSIRKNFLHFKIVLEHNSSSYPFLHLPSAFYDSSSLTHAYGDTGTKLFEIIFLYNSIMGIFVLDGAYVVFTFYFSGNYQQWTSNDLRTGFVEVVFVNLLHSELIISWEGHFQIFYFSVCCMYNVVLD